MKEGLKLANQVCFSPDPTCRHRI